MEEGADSVSDDTVRYGAIVESETMVKQVVVVVVGGVEQPSTMGSPWQALTLRYSQPSDRPKTPKPPCPGQASNQAGVE